MPTASGSTSGATASSPSTTRSCRRRPGRRRRRSSWRRARWHRPATARRSARRISPQLLQGPRQLQAPGRLHRGLPVPRAGPRRQRPRGAPLHRHPPLRAAQGEGDQGRQRGQARACPDPDHAHIRPPGTAGGDRRARLAVLVHAAVANLGGSQRSREGLAQSVDRTVPGLLNATRVPTLDELATLAPLESAPLRGGRAANQRAAHRVGARVHPAHRGALVRPAADRGRGSAMPSDAISATQDIPVGYTDACATRPGRSGADRDAIPSRLGLDLRIPDVRPGAATQPRPAQRACSRRVLAAEPGRAAPPART